MKLIIDNVIVVEGKSDAAFLSSFIDAVFVTTNGYEIPFSEIAFLNNKRNNKPVIVLTDSDEAGKQIRERLNNLLNNKVNIEVDVLKCNKNGKHGIAECDNNEIVNVLKEHFSDTKPSHSITSADIVELGINKDKRIELCEKLELGNCNNKTFVKRLNYLGYSKDELREYENK